MKWIEIPAHFLVKEGIQLVKLREKTFCLVFYEGRFVAFSQKCPHAGAPLQQGWCEEGKIVCAYHRQRFDLQTGKGEEGQGNYINIYPTKCEEMRWYVGLKPTFWERIFS
jgi:nitrite reductase (NADH) small subunit